jgi:hypothetical protein
MHFLLLELLETITYQKYLENLRKPYTFAIPTL